MLKRIIQALLVEYPDLLVIDGRLVIRGVDCTEPIEILLDSIEAEPERADDLLEQAVERVEIWIDPEAYARKYLRRSASA